LITDSTTAAYPSIGFHKNGLEAMTLVYTGSKTLKVRSHDDATLYTVCTTFNHNTSGDPHTQYATKTNVFSLSTNYIPYYTGSVFANTIMRSNQNNTRVAIDTSGGTIDIYGSGTDTYIASSGNSQDLNIIATDELYLNASYIKMYPDADVTFDMSAGGSFYITSIAGSTGGSTIRISSAGVVYKDTSSIRFKENIRYDIDTSWLHLIRVCKYDRKDGAKKNEIGIIAEQLADLCPGVITNDVTGKIDGYNKEDLIPALINEIQLLKKEIAELKI
jgi:hypothetical protein